MKISRRDFLKIAGLGLGGMLIPPAAAIFPLGVITYMDVRRPMLALTIDDCWSAYMNGRFLSMLIGGAAQATWFPVGQALRQFKDLQWSLNLSGCTVGYHSMTHPDTEEAWHWTVDHWKQDYDQYWRELEKYPGMLASYRPFARAPNGLFTRAFLKMCKDYDQTPIGWSNEPGEYNRGYKFLPGQIVLSHARESDYGFVGNLLRQDGVGVVDMETLFANRTMTGPDDRSRPT